MIFFITDTNLLLSSQSPNFIFPLCFDKQKCPKLLTESKAGPKAVDFLIFMVQGNYLITNFNKTLPQVLWDCISMKSLQINGSINYNKAIILFVFIVLYVQAKQMPPILSGFVLTTTPVNCIFTCGHR